MLCHAKFVTCVIQEKKVHRESADIFHKIKKMARSKKGKVGKVGESEWKP